MCIVGSGLSINYVTFQTWGEAEGMITRVMVIILAMRGDEKVT